jgi:hypothetical protein
VSGAPAVPSPAELNAWLLGAATDPAMTPDAVRLTLYVANLGVGWHRYDRAAFAALLKDTSRAVGDSRIAAALRTAEECGHLVRKRGGRGHSDAFQAGAFTPADPQGLTPVSPAETEELSDRPAEPQGLNDTPAETEVVSDPAPAPDDSAAETEVVTDRPAEPQGLNGREPGAEPAPHAGDSLSGVKEQITTPLVAAVVGSARDGDGGDGFAGFGEVGEDAPAVGPPPRPDGLTDREIRRAALAEMEAAAAEFGAAVEDPTERRGFYAQAKLHARGEDRSVWRDPRPELRGEEVAPWWDRARIFRLALPLLLLPRSHKDHRGDLRGAITLALQKQYHPPKIREVVPGTDHARQEDRYRSAAGQSGKHVVEVPGSQRALHGTRSSPELIGSVVQLPVPAEAVSAWMEDPANAARLKALRDKAADDIPKIVTGTRRDVMLDGLLRGKVAHEIRRAPGAGMPGGMPAAEAAN